MESEHQEDIQHYKTMNKQLKDCLKKLTSKLSKSEATIEEFKYESEELQAKLNMKYGES